MVRQHHPPNGPESEQTLGDSKGQGSLACCSLWGHKESDTVSDQTTTTNRKPLGFLSEFFSLSWRWLPGAFNLSDIICFGHTVVRGWQPQNLWCQILKKKKKKTAWMQTHRHHRGDGREVLSSWGGMTKMPDRHQMTSASVDRVQPRASTGHVGSSQRLFIHTSLLSLPLRPFEKRSKSPFIRICWFRQTAKPRWLWWTHCVGWNEFPCGQLPCCCLTKTRGSQSC